MKIKGQNFRLLKNSVVFPESTNCTITQNGNTEDISTKDVEGMYSQNSVVSTSWNAQVDTNEGDASQLRAILTLFNAAEAVPIGWDQTGGAGNAVPQNANFKRSGNALLIDFTMDFSDREIVRTSLQFQGTGGLS